jgi:cytidylate kinase
VSVPVIAIDGPSGSGKGSLAAMVAAALGFHLLDSGALYRLLALQALSRGVAADDVAALAVLAAALPATFEEGAPGEPARVLLEGQDVGSRIREEDVGQLASRVAGHAPVRQALLQRQRDFARAPGLVADGRDMGTVVFPAAPLKVFLDADVDERALRRQKQLQKQGVSASVAALAEDLRARDERDRNRPVAPLRPAGDAVVIDSTRLSLQDVFQQVMSLVAQRLPGAGPR